MVLYAKGPEIRHHVPWSPLYLLTLLNLARYRLTLYNGPGPHSVYSVYHGEIWRPVCQRPSRWRYLSRT